MGNTSSSNLDVDQIVNECDVPEESTPARIQIQYQEQLYPLTLVCGGLNFMIFPECDSRLWVPRTHMRDFEVVDPHSAKEIKIARGQGVGVIVVPRERTYLKLYHHDGCLRPANFGTYHSLDELKELLHPDLGLGYEVLIVEGRSGWKSYCEKLDERDEAKTDIVISSCRGLDQYQADQ